MKKEKHSCTNLSLLIIGIILGGIGITLLTYFEQFYDYLIISAMAFTPESKAFRVWKINNPPLDMEIFIFNWTNPEDIRNPNVKPKFEEIGPYKFKEIKEKVNITWNNNNNTISYKTKKSFFFDYENSVRNLSDIVTIINAVPLTIAYKARDYGYFSKKTISYSLASLSSLYVTKPVQDILFNGYEESILSILSNMPIVDVKDKFGYYYGINGTSGNDGIFNMWINNDKNFGKIQMWNYKTNSQHFEGDCGIIKGSAGEFYSINQKRESLEVFFSEICKFSLLEYDKDVNIKGVKGYKYTGKNIFDNGKLNANNKCFCTGDCLPSGVLNVSTCRNGSPTFLSMPHFYNADAYYLNSIDGLSPNSSHEFYITLEPKSGVIIDVGARIQVNMLLQPIDYITMYEDVPKILIPIFYFNQVLTISDEIASNLKTIQNLPEVSNIIILITIITGVLLFVCLIINIYCVSLKKQLNNRNKNKIPTGHSEEIPLRI